MVLLCFVLDLRSLSPPLLGDLKQALLQLGNFYAISSCRSDKIGLCCLLFDRISSSRQLKIAYIPRENFSLRDFHHAVNSLPTDAFFPYINETTSDSSHDLNLTSVLSHGVLYSWGDKDVVRRKVIFLTSCLDGIGNIDSVTRKTLMDAADKCVSVEFVLLEQKSSHLRHSPENISEFVKHICDLENCCFHSYLPDSQILNGLVKHWLRELKDDVEESLQARFIFKSNLLGSVNSIYCKLSLALSQINDDFIPCQMGLRDYNPVLHERGFHQKLNLLVKECLHFGSIPSKAKVATTEPNSTQLDLPEVTVLSNSAIEIRTKEDEVPRLDCAAAEDKTTACIADEWEQLIVNEVPKLHTPILISKHNLEQLVLSPPNSSRQLDVTTSRILERLENPRQMKTKAVSPIIKSNVTTDVSAQTKNPLFPIQPNHAADHSLIASQPMKPSFQRLKRKHR